MLNRIEVRKKNGTILPLALGEVTDGITVQDIEGLDPGKLDENEPRQILIKLGMEPDYAANGNVQAIRRRLYEFFMPKTVINLRFYLSETSFVEIDGKVENMETPLFTQEPVAAISVLCDKRLFYNPVWVETYGKTAMDNSPEKQIINSGSVEAGFILQVFPDKEISSFSFVHRDQENKIKSMDFNATLYPGDTVTVNTIPGEKGVTLLRGGSTRSYLASVTPSSPWISIPPGLSFYSVFSPNGVGVPYVLSFMERHGGL